MNSSILVYVLWDYVASERLIYWLAGLWSVTICRALLSASFLRRNPAVDECGRWYPAFLAGTSLSGALWGSAAWIPGSSPDPVGLLFIAFMLAGMTAGAVTVLSAKPLAFISFSGPALLPLALQCFNQNHPVSHAMGVMTLLFLGGTCMASSSMHKTLHSSLRLRFSNDMLNQLIRQRERAEKNLFTETQRLRITLKSLSEGVVITDAGGIIAYINLVAETLCGWKNSEAVGKPVESIVHCFNERTRQPDEPAISACLGNKLKIERTTLLLTRGGTDHLVKQITTPLFDESKQLTGTVTVLRDITLERKQNRELAHKANHDWLTQLPNRALLWDRLSHAVTRAGRVEKQLAILFIDLDWFKETNDQLGHAAGDTMLITTAERLKSSVRLEDTVARLGGDEFVVMIEGIDNPAEADQIAEKIRKSLSVPVSTPQWTAPVTASIGIAIYPTDGNDAESLLNNADRAMYRSKQQGRNKVRLFGQEEKPETTQSSKDRMQPD